MTESKTEDNPAQKILSKEDTNLDVLRSLAVLMVLAYHAEVMYGKSPFWSNIGHFGVLIFFVHTSLVLMMSLQRMASRQTEIVHSFYIQRAARIYPLSVLCVICAVTFHIPVNHVDVWVKPPTGVVISNLLLLNNTGGGPISGPMWSLPYEVQMYLVLPFLFFLLRRDSRPVVIVALIVGAFLCAAAELFVHLARVAQYFPCFMGGILAYWLLKSQRRILSPILVPIWVILLALIYSKVPQFLNLTGAVFCLVLGATIGLFKVSAPNFGTTAAHAIAKYSYGIYLAHMPLFWLCFYKLRLGSQWASWALFSSLLVVTVLVLYHCIEHPMIKLGKKLSRRSVRPAAAPFPTLTNA
jgi:peptidoglycan/LPS O-acetylase OafA/YrhL